MPPAKHTNLFKFLSLSLISTLLLVNDSVFAAEGFHLKPKSRNSAVAQMWPKVFSLLRFGEHGFSGTAFLVKVSGHQAYFITNRHVVAECPEKEVCADLQLAQNVAIEKGADGVLQTTFSGFRFKQVRLVRSSAHPDLALLEAGVDAHDSLKLPEPIDVEKSCLVGLPAAKTRLYTVGFPWTPDRTAFNRKPIREQNRVTKRWSEGHFVEVTMKRIPLTMELDSFIETTVDVLMSNSGGPLFTEQGFLAGVIKGGYSSDWKTNAYAGTNSPGDVVATSSSIGCDDLKNFLAPAF